MISEWFIQMWTGIQTWFVGLFGTADPPAFLAQVAGFIGDLSARISGLGAWMPMGLLGTVAVAVLGLWFALWVVKFVRWVWGLTPFSGGS